MDMFPDNWPNKVEEMRSPQRRQPPCTTSHNLLHRRLGFPRIRIPDLVRRQTYGARKHCGQCLWQLHDPLHIGKNHSARSCVCMVELLRRSDSRPGIPLFLRLPGSLLNFLFFASQASQRDVSLGRVMSKSESKWTVRAKYLTKKGFLRNHCYATEQKRKTTGEVEKIKPL